CQQCHATPRLWVLPLHGSEPLVGQFAPVRAGRRDRRKCREVSASLGTAQALEWTRTGQPCALPEEQTARIADDERHVELIEQPSLASRDPADGPSVEPHERTVRVGRNLGTLAQTRAWRRKQVIGHVLERRIALDARRELVDGRRTQAAVDT